MKSINHSLSWNTRLSESYVVKYWDRSGEFVKQSSQLVYAKSKDAHKSVSVFVCKTFNVKHEDIISVNYQ